MENKSKRASVRIKRAAKRAGRAAAGAGVAVSLLLGSLFSTPAELMKDKSPVPTAPPAVVQTVEADPVYDNFTLEQEPEAEEKRTLREKLRQLILRIPAVLRALLLLPAWAIGFAIIQAVTLLFTALGIPVVGTVLRFLLCAGLVFGLIIGAEKLLFPDVPLKKLLSKRNLGALALTALLIAAVGALGDFLWRDKRYITLAAEALAALLYVAYFMLFVRGNRRAPEET